MIKLYSFSSSLGVVDPSPFVLKVDAYMRLARIEFTHCPDANNIQKAPKGKLPYIIDDGENTVSDSEFIIAYLQKKYAIDLDSHLSEEQKGIAYLMGKSLDENLYWCLVYSRWAKDDSWIHVKKEFFASMPLAVKMIVLPFIRYNIVGALHKQGLGRHSEQEIYQIANKTFQALSNILGDTPYFFGDTPCTFDATTFGFLTQFISVSLDNETNDLARQYSNLVDYCQRINDLYYD